VVKKKGSVKKVHSPAWGTITQQKRDRVAAILAVVLGLLSIRQGGSVLLGLWVPDYPVISWLVWYNVVMGFVSVGAGVGMWQRRAWSSALAVNILAFHGIVFAGLVAMHQFGQVVASQSLFAMLFRTFTWIVIYSLLRWRRQEDR